MRHFILLLSLLFCLTARGQQPYFHHITTANGLPSSMVYQVMTDSRGYLWILTGQGIVRYDGVSYTAMDSRYGLKAKSAFRMFLSKDDKVWFITLDFKVFYFEENRFHLLHTNKDIAWLDEDVTGHIYFIARNGEILSLDTNYSLHRLSPLPNYMGGYCLKILPDSSFIASTTSGIVHIGPQWNYKLLAACTPYTEQVVPRFTCLQNGNILMSTSKGIYTYNPHKKQIVHFLPMIKNEIYSFHEDSVTHDVWIGTHKGLFIFKEGRLDSKPLQYLTDKAVFHIYLSHDKYWISTGEDGIYSVNMHATHFDKADGLSTQKISFIKKDNGIVYLFSQDGTIQGLKNDCIFHGVNHLSLKGKISRIKNVINSCDGLLLVSEKPLYLHNQQFTSPSPHDGFVFYSCPYTYYLYLGSIMRKGLQKPIYELTDKKMRDTMLKYGVSDVPLAVKNDSCFYFGIRDGYCKLVKENGRYHFYPYVIGTSVSKIIITPSDNLILSTLSKGIAVAYKNGQTLFYSKEKGLLSEYCSNMYIHGNSIWVPTNKGISKLLFTKDDSLVKIINYTTENVLRTSEVNDLLVDNTKVYVATNEGVSMFDADYENKLPPPEVIIENIQINNIDTPLSSFYELPYTQNTITIRFKSPSVLNEANILYEYSIESDHKQILKEHSLTPILQLSSLSPGDYIVSIRARSADGVWSVNPVQLKFVILAPFWKRWWFILGYVSLAVTLGVLYLTNLKKQSRTQSQLLESQLKALRLQMNPHFIFNTLNSLQMFILEHKPIDANQYISKFSQLIRWVMIYSDRQELTLYEELAFLNTYVELEQLRFEQTFLLYSDIDPEINLHGTYIPSLILQPLIENAIKYGLTPKKENGVIQLHFQKKGKYLFTVIRDNGVGRAKSRTMNGHHHGFESTGMKSIEERLKLLTGPDRPPVMMRVIDLMEDDEPAGTCIELMIPIL
ncbi:MAG: histidine kinase [Bacteroidota bacterium]